MELLLLDTTENEGEDNKLYHFQQHASKKPQSSWRELRGVLAAAVGTTSSVCGEPLQCAHFRFNDNFDTEASGNDVTAAVGFVNLYEVLYVLVFPSALHVPNAVVQYYTRSSCDLLLSLFGYPDAKLREWTTNATITESELLKERLDSFFATVFAVITQDLAGETHLQFTFSGRVPVVNYPLDILAELAIWQPLNVRDDSLGKAVIAGRCIRFRNSVMLTTIRPDLMRLINQWLLLEPGNFAPQASFCSTNALDGFKVFTFELHDIRFARHGFYPTRHALLILERDDVRQRFVYICLLDREHRDISIFTSLGHCVYQLQVVYLVQKNLDSGHSVEKPISHELIRNLDHNALQQLSQLVSSTLTGYHDDIQRVRLENYDLGLTSTSVSGEAQQPTSPGFLSYLVVHDQLRDVIIGESFQERCRLGHHQSLGHPSAAQKTAYEPIFSLFVNRITTFQQTYQSSEPFEKRKPNAAANDPDLPTWISPVKLDIDDPNTLFLHEKNSDSGADISSEDAHIFPPPGETLFTVSTEQPRLVYQDAESHVITSTGQKLWIVVNYYETVNLFAVFDADLVTLDTIEQEMDRICAFGGYARIDGSSPA